MCVRALAPSFVSDRHHFLPEAKFLNLGSSIGFYTLALLLFISMSIPILPVSSAASFFTSIIS